MTSSEAASTARESLCSLRRRNSSRTYHARSSGVSRSRAGPGLHSVQARDDTAIAGANSPCSKNLGARSCRHLRPADIFRHGTTDPAATRESPCFRLHHSSSTPPHRCHQLVGSPRSPQLNSLGTLTGHHPTEAVPLEVHRGADGRYVAVPSSHWGESIFSAEHGGNVARSELGHLFARPSSR